MGVQCKPFYDIIYPRKQKGHNMRFSNTKRHVLTTLVILNLTLILGIVFALYMNKPIAHSKMASRTNQYIIANVPKETIKKNIEEAPANYSWDEVKPHDPDQVISSPPPQPQDLPVIAGIAIPELGINMPIVKGLDNIGLYYGAGTTKENQTMGQGNYGLASHHVFGINGATDLLFSPLEYAKEGQKIYLTDKDTIYTYTITNIERVDPTRTDVLDEPGSDKNPIVTLITCTDVYAQGRIVVQGTLTDKIAYNNAPENIKSAFKQTYNIWQQ